MITAASSRRVYLLALTTAAALTTACGGGGGSGSSPSMPGAPAPAPGSAPAPAPARNYKMKALGLLAGQYPVSCTQVGSSTPTLELLTIGSMGDVQLGSRGSASFAAIDAVFSIDQTVGVPAPGVAVALLGKSGETNIGVTFTGSGSAAPAGHQLKDFFYEHSPTRVNLRCVPSAASGLAAVSWEDTIADLLGSAIGSLRCTVGASPVLVAHQYAMSSGRFTLVGSSGVTGATSVSLDIRQPKASELLQLPGDQANPTQITQDNLAYGLKLQDGTWLNIIRHATDGIVRLTIEAPAAARIACER